jgi:hypothetical protein
MKKLPLISAVWFLMTGITPGINFITGVNNTGDKLKYMTGWLYPGNPSSPPNLQEHPKAGTLCAPNVI